MRGMKYVKQAFLIFFLSFLGEVLRYFIPIPVPSAVYGLVILFLLLMTGVLKVESVKEVSSFLIEIMPMMFIPSAVGIMTLKEEVGNMLIPLIVASTILTALVMGISGKVTDILIGRKKHE